MEGLVADAAATWERLVGMLQSGDLSDMPSLYDQDALFLEPYNPPHRGNLLIQAYLKDYLSGKDKVVIETKRLVIAEGGTRMAVEWTLSYDAAGRRWSDLPRGTFFDFDTDTGLVTYQREYA
jgi:ketosteroid isomerase-like protein